MVLPALLALYYLVLAALAFYGVHRLLLVCLYVRNRRRKASPPPDPDVWPVVTVQLPLYNEMYVATRLLDAVCALDYPRDRLEVQVLDDSTDETTEVVARAVARWRAAGHDVRHLHRTDRRGFKAGALAAGLAAARGELVAVFDADFVPRPDFLRRTVPFFADSGVAMVQGSWEHINRGYSLLTRIEAILLDGHFLIEHTARHRSGCFFNFNGTAGIWRREAIEQAGGWQHDTLTEDLDLSYRAQLQGWRFVYVPELGVPSELPVDINGFKSQQYRWTKGSIQTGRKLLARILSSDLPPRVKFEAFVHLTNNTSYLLMIALSALLFPAMLARRGAAAGTLLLVDLPLFLAASVSVVVFYLASQVISHGAHGAQGAHRAAGLSGSWRREARYLPALMGLGIGLAVNNSRAVLSGLFRRGGTFHRTPKYRIERPGEDWKRKRYRAAAGPLVALEGALALYFLGCSAYAATHGMWASLPFLVLFVQGYGYMFLLSVLPSLRKPRLAADASGSLR